MSNKPEISDYYTIIIDEDHYNRLQEYGAVNFNKKLKTSWKTIKREADHNNSIPVIFHRKYADKTETSYGHLKYAERCTETRRKDILIDYIPEELFTL